MNIAQFAKTLGIHQAALAHITSGRLKPSVDVLTKIVNRFEDINPGWLLTGKGSMKITPHVEGEFIKMENFNV